MMLLLSAAVLVAVALGLAVMSTVAFDMEPMRWQSGYKDGQ